MALDLGAIQDEAARSWNLDPAFFRAIGTVESGNNVNSPDSSAGAQGPMQVMPGTASDMGVTDPRDPVQNVYASAKYLSGLVDRYKSPDLAAAAYNAGPGRVDDYLAGKAPLPAETQSYVPKVAAAYRGMTGGSTDTSDDPFASGTRYAEAGTPTMTDASTGPAPQGAVDPFSAALAAAHASAGTDGSSSASPTPPSGASSSQQQGSDPFSAAIAAAKAHADAGTDNDPAASDTPTPAPNTPQAQWHQGTILGRLVGGAEDVGSGVAAGFSGAVGGAASLAAKADAAVPFLRNLDASTGLNPAHAQAVLQGYAKGQDAAHAGSIPYDVGDFVGTTAAVTPMVELGGGAFGLAGGAVADALPVGGNLVKAGTNLLAGGGTPAARYVTGATSGAAKAIAAGGIANGDFSNSYDNALTGGVLGAAAPAIAPYLAKLGSSASGAGSLVSRGINALAGDGRPAPVQNLLAPDTTVDAAPGLTGNRLAAGSPEPVPASAGSTASRSGPGATTAPPQAPGAPPPSQSAPSPAQPTPDSPRLSVGFIPRVSNADQLAQQALDHYMAGGPTQVVQSQIPGVVLTKAQATGNANVAALERAMRDQAPNVFDAVDKSNNTARVSYLQGITGTPDQIDAAEADRDAVTSQAREAAFANKSPVDASPVVDQLQQLIAKNGARPTVSGPLQQVMSQLAPKDADGDRVPLTDPEQLYNLRQYLGDMISPRATGTANDGQAAAAQLMQLKPTLDSVIENGAPGFQDYIGQFDQLSQPIDAMRFLQSKKLVSDDGVISRAKLGQMLHTIQQQQMAPGYRAADSLTPAQLQALTALHDDLNMAARSSTLGKSLGSNTAQNLFTNSKTGALIAGKGGAVADYIGAGLGFHETGSAMGGAAGLAVHGARALYANKLAGVQAAARSALANKLAGVSP